MTEPSRTALDTAAIVDAKVHGRQAPVRRIFVERLVPEGDAPPMTMMLRGGRGGEVRLKLFLAMLWFAGKEPHDVSYPARAWAALLDLDDPEGNGARRVADAIVWLGDRQFVRREPRPGRPTKVFLLNESGDGSEYELPWESLNELKEHREDDIAALRRRHQYFSLPAAFWTEGWFARLSGRALAMLLAVLAEMSRDDATTEVWFSPSRADQRFDLSTETRSLGFRELEECGILSKRRAPVNADVFDFRRVRNVYRLEIPALRASSAS